MNRNLVPPKVVVVVYRYNRVGLYNTDYYDLYNRNIIPVGPLTPLSSATLSAKHCATGLGQSLCTGLTEFGHLPGSRRRLPISFAWATRLGGWRLLSSANATVSNAAPATPQRWQRRKRRASVGHPAGLTCWERGSRSGSARQRSGIIVPPHCGAAQPVEAPANS